MSLDLDTVTFGRYRVPVPFGSRRTDEATYLLGTVAACQCHREAAVHLLRLEKDPERLAPVCGTGDVRWVHDNHEGGLEEVTCSRCLNMIRKAGRS